MEYYLIINNYKNIFFRKMIELDVIKLKEMSYLGKIGNPVLFSYSESNLVLF